MPFEILDTLSLPGDPLKPNDDAFGHAQNAAVVIDGATSLGDPLMPGDSDAAWLAHFGARRLMAHVWDGDAPQDALRHTLADAKKSYEALRRRPPQAQWEMPHASMAFAFEAPDGLDFLWFGDCAGVLKRPGAAVEVLGEAIAAKTREAARVAKLAKESGLSPVGAGGNRPEFLPALRQARNLLNSAARYWVFSPEPRAADFVGSRRVAAPRGALLLLASDGFLALVTDYGRYSEDTLMDKALAKGLGLLADELREIEDADPQGHKHPRFKKSDDATAVLLKLV
ncbi:MAG TPA: protein phosphatase 2C domain-containing protein [Rhizomicrobium sp.]|nr:protein phosphatase 2C domain-containing protein [Rhizomicrobium sp.]